ncbi:MAG: YkgJ family cysteine cluster protein, partial [Deltaproteobacteria bacterium]
MAEDSELFVHDPFGAGDVYGLGGQLAWEPLDDHLAALLAVDEAPDGDCERCELTCCTYVITVPEVEVGRVTQAAARVGLAGPALFQVRGAEDDPNARLLNRRDGGHCLFLDGSSRCRIHAAAGPEAKPSVCQLYPGQPTVTPLGARVLTRAECPWPRRTRDDEAVARYGRALASRRGVAPRLLVRVAPDEIRIDAGTTVPFAAFDAWLTEAV